MSRLTVARGHRVLAAAVGIALVAGSAWAVTSGPLSTVGDDVDCRVTEAPTLDEAARIAQACGHDVAAVDLHDPWSTSIATPQSTVREELSAGAVRTDLTGEWQPVDPTVVVDPSTGDLKVASPVYDITLDPADGDGFLSIVADEAEISVGAPVDLGAPVVDGPSVSWPLLDDSGEVIDGTSLVAHVHPDATGVTPVIEVRDPEAYHALENAAGDTGVAFEILASDGLVLDDATTGDGFEAVDEQTGEPVFAAGEAPRDPVLLVRRADGGDADRPRTRRCRVTGQRPARHDARGGPEHPVDGVERDEGLHRSLRRHPG